MRYTLFIALALQLIGCRTFDDESVRRGAQLEHQTRAVAGDPESVPEVYGLAVENIDSSFINERVIVAYTDSAMNWRTAVGTIDAINQQDSVIELRRVKDKDLPLSLSVAMRNIDQIYPQRMNVEHERSDTGATVGVWLLVLTSLFGILAIAASGMTLRMGSFGGGGVRWSI